jgi:hypothetical protein
MADEEYFFLQKEMPPFRFNENTKKVKTKMPKGRMAKEAILLAALAMTKKVWISLKLRIYKHLLSLKCPQS